MKVYHGIDEFEKLQCAVVTSGMFDGVHQGHEKIIGRLKEVCDSCGGEPVVITFWPHPRLIVSEDSQDLKLITTIEEKIARLSELGVKHLIILPFTRAFSELSSDGFIRRYLVSAIGTQKLVIGYDHRFGKNREGSFEFLKENASQYGFEVEEIVRQDIDDMAVSSSRIRKALMDGDVTLANTLLGYTYSFSGTVVKGKQLGRTLGFPTANLQVPEGYKLIPADGIYAVRVRHGENRWFGMMSIGMNPTVEGKEKTIEVNIFDFDKDVYGETLTIEVHKYLRAEAKFDSLEALVAQIKQDKLDTLTYFQQ